MAKLYYFAKTFCGNLSSACDMPFSYEQVIGNFKKSISVQFTAKLFILAESQYIAKKKNNK